MDLFDWKLIGSLGLLILFVFAYVSFSNGKKMQSRVDDLQEKTMNVTRLSRQISQLIGVSPTEKIGASLKNLKSRVDYSNNISTEHSVEHEVHFFELLQGIHEAISAGEEEDTILEKVAAAENVWRERNTFY